MSKSKFDFKTKPTASVERKIIHILLKDKDAIDECIHELPEMAFTTEYRPLVCAIYDYYLKGNKRRLLTRNAYVDYLKRDKRLNLDDGDIFNAGSNYDVFKVKYYAHPDEITHLKEELMQSFTARCISSCMDKLAEDIQDLGYVDAYKRFIQNMHYEGPKGNTKKHELFHVDKTLRDNFIEDFEARAIEEVKQVTCSIPEIDNVINVGMRPQHMTLVVADVGGGKTTLMLNMALNIYENGYKVLFVPLEMGGRYDLMCKIIANKAGILSNDIAKPQDLDASDLEYVKTKIRECSIWEKPGFDILDVGDRITVSQLENELNKGYPSEKPDVIVIDYIANLKPDKENTSRNDLEIGEILKSLRFLGKRMDFHIISGAQMGRDAIRKLRDSQDSAVVDSTAIRGSHEYSADADTIFGIVPILSQPDTVKLVTIKARHGPKKSGELKVNWAKSQIWSASCHQSSVSMKHVNDSVLDNLSKDILSPLPDRGKAGLSTEEGGKEEDYKKPRPDRDIMFGDLGFG